MTSLDALIPELDALTDEQASRFHHIMTLCWMEHYKFHMQTPMSVWILTKPDMVADVLARVRREAQ